ncbi:hypothetical protein GF360_03110 [candidate division WWE3 bacterium]|nr:hypothetical protein [candidate division WWE3 bacterium]
MFLRKALISIAILFASLLSTSKVLAQEPPQENVIYKGEVLQVLEQGHSEFGENYQKLEILLYSKDPSSEETLTKKITVENNPQNSSKVITYQKGDKVLLQEIPAKDPTQNNATYIITDFQRTGYLIFLFAIFILFTLIIGRKYGFYSLLGMVLSFLIIFKFILPQIAAGKSPILITLLATAFIIPITFYLSHGFNRKTHAAIVSTLITLVAIGLFTVISVSAANLTGYASEEAMFLQVANQHINMRGILLAGIIIGFLGILDDVSISQASTVFQLKEANQQYGTLELYKHAMEVGRDHIASMINTLVLVYTGASMPLLLLFLESTQSFGSILNREIIADEVIRTLIGSIGLILAVPLSTFISAILAEGE